jgi:hypothetical protein
LPLHPIPSPHSTTPPITLASHPPHPIKKKFTGKKIIKKIFGKKIFGKKDFGCKEFREKKVSGLTPSFFHAEFIAPSAVRQGLRVRSLG